MTMEKEQKNNIDDEVIKVYLEIYLNAIKSEKPQKYIDIVQNRMMFLVKRKRIDNN